MNPGKLNHKIRFIQEVATQNASGGTTMTTVPVVCSDGPDTDITRGSLEPLSRVGIYNQLANELGSTVFNLGKICIIRNRKSFRPDKTMLFEDVNTPGDIYTIHSVAPYWPGTKSTFQSSQEQVYKDNVYVFIVGILRT